MAFRDKEKYRNKDIQRGSRLSGAILVICALVVTAPQAFAEVVDRVVANVNGEVILLSDVRERITMLKGFGQQRDEAAESLDEKKILDGMIDEKLVFLFAEEREIKITEGEIDKAIENILTTNKINMRILEDALSKEGMDMESYRKRMREQMMTQRISGMEISAAQVTDMEARKHYEENLDIFVRPGRVRASHIILLASKEADPVYYDDAKKKIEDIKKEIEDGLSFEEAAKTHSQDGTSQKGGDLGWFGRGKMIPEFEEAAFSADVGSVVGPVETAFGIHLLLVTEKEEPEPIPFDDIKKRIKSALQREAFGKKQKTWMETLRSQAYIKVMY